MTVEERAKQAIEQSAIPPQFSQWWAIAISPEQTNALIQSTAQALRDQIEDCAKVAREEIEKWDRQYLGELRESVVFTIRALAGQTDQTEGKEGER